jgi:hypothetical protein
LQRFSDRGRITVDDRQISANSTLGLGLVLFPLLEGARIQGIRGREFRLRHSGPAADRFHIDWSRHRIALLAPDLWLGPLREQRFSNLSVIPVPWQRPLYASRLGGGNIIVNGGRDQSDIRCNESDLLLKSISAANLTLPSVSVSLNNLDPSPSWLWES